MYLRSTIFPLLVLLVVFQSPQDSIRQHYQAAEAHRLAGNLAGAESEFAAILAEAYGRLGKIYSARKQYQEAITILESAASRAPDSQEVLLDLAIAYFDAGQYQKAFAPVRKVVALNPESTGGHHMLGKTYFMLGDFPAATTELEAALKLAPNDHDVAYTLGLGYLKQRQFIPAKRIYDRILKQFGDRPQLRIIFGRAYRETGFLPEAIEEFKRAVALDPRFPRAHYYLGLTYLLKDGTARLNDAREEFKIELAANPDEFFANYYLGVIYAIEREWDPAIRFLQKASRIQPNNPDPYFHLGQAYQSQGGHEQAIEVLRKSIALNPQLSHNDYQVTSAHYRLGQSLLKVGQIEEGNRELQLAAQLKSESFKRDEERATAYLNATSLSEQNNTAPAITSAGGVVAITTALDEKTRRDLNTSEAYYTKVVAGAHNNLGMLQAQRENFRKAVEEFASAAKWDPELEGLNFNWGLACFKSEQFNEAIPPLEKELSKYATNTAASQLLGMSYFMVDNYAKASELLGRVLANNPDEAGLHYPLAIALMKQGKKDEADRVIKQMLERGNSPQVHMLLGQAFYDQGDTTKALDELKSALSLDSKTPLAHYHSGLIYLKLGKLDRAEQELENELVLNPKDVRARYHLAFVLLANQKSEQGIKLMREVIQLKPDYAEAHYELGKALLQKGEIQAAVDNLEAAIKLKPEESFIRYQLGRAYLAAGRKPEGENQLEIYRKLKDRERSQTNP
ncbi:MAG: tetratricopeptide repeat protein [Pyrinomonadaceae bacterium]